MTPITVCYTGTGAGDYGGASRVLFTTLSQIDRRKISPLVLLPKAGPIESWLQEQRIPYRIWGATLHEKTSWREYARQVARGFSLLKDTGSRILHVHNAGFWRPAEFVAAKLAGVKIVTHLHVTVATPPPFLALSDLIIANSQYTASASATCGRPVRVVHNTISPARFRPGSDLRPELGVRRPVTVVFVGQIKEIKGIQTFITVARKLHAEDAEFWIFGECKGDDAQGGGFSKARLQAALADLPNIRYGGFREDIQNVFSMADIVVVPSTWGEPFGLVNIEAGLVGTPVVASNVGGIPEIVEDGVTGYLVAPDDIDGFATRIRELIRSPELRDRMGREAQAVITRRFVSGPITTLENIYGELAHPHLRYPVTPFSARG